MTVPKRYLLLFFVLAFGLSMSACGGGSNSTPPPVPADFSMTVPSGSIAVTQGGSSSPVSISISPLHNFSGSVSIAITGLPSGVTTSPAMPFQVAAGAAQAVTFSAANSATLGPVNLTFQGTSGSLSHSAGGTMSVAAAPDFSLSIAPNQLSVTQGASSGPIAVVVSPLNSFSGTVNVAINGLPAGVVASPASLQISAGSKQQITFSAASSAAPGTANATLQGTSGSLTHSVPASLQIQAAAIPDFSLSVDSGAVALKPGTNQGLNLMVGSINHFGDNVAISISGLPKGVTVSPASFAAAAGSTTKLTFSAASGTPAANTKLTIAGNDGSLNHSVTAGLQVLAAAAGATPTVSVTYFDNSVITPAPDSIIRIVNPGVQSTSSVLGDLCANIYVFDSTQQLDECCSCPVTANGLIRLSLSTNLLSNPDGAAVFATSVSGSVVVVPSTLSATTPCDPTSYTPVPNGLNVWGAHPTNSGKLVETLAPTTPLSGGELTELQSFCGFIVSNDSRAGICSCPSSD